MVLALAFLVAAQAGAQPPPSPAPPAARAPSFSIRADPSIADRVNAVLRRAAAPTVTSLPSESDLRSALSEACGGRPAPEIQAVREVGGSTVTDVRHAPCVRFGRGAAIEAQGAENLKDLAAAVGLTASSSQPARIVRGTAEIPVSLASRLEPGDIVRFPRMPVWTDVTLAADGAFPDRPALIAALAQAFDCEAGKAEPCLNRLGLHVLNREPLPPAPISRLVVPQSSSPPAGEPRIPDSQWPYDHALVAEILNNTHVPSNPVAIGVADSGLGSRSGAPLPQEAFSRNPGEGDAPDGIDNEDNNYADDIYGTGVARLPDEQQTAGSVGLCSSDNPDLTGLDPNMRGLADHGTIVSAIASGFPLRGLVHEPSALPRLIFFRLLPDLCRPDAEGGPSEASFREAHDYLFGTRRADIFLLSYLFERQTSSSFEDAMAGALFNQDQRLFIVPAGNNGPDDLDESRFCPPCFGNPYYQERTFRNTIVVGAADQSLRVAAYSRFGPRTVTLYAPAETDGAPDLMGNTTNRYAPSTSWAAPYVALAAGLLRSLGIKDNAEITERLSAATWPIDAPPNQVDARAGVLNLMKVVAVRHDALEVIEARAGGRLERRTYVGTLLTPIDTFCQGPVLSPRTTHSIRLGAASGDQRELILRMRSPEQRHFKDVRRWCAIPSTIRFRALLVDHDLDIESRSVVHILLPWFPPEQQGNGP
jgi:hypothetical protein